MGPVGRDNRRYIGVEGPNGNRKGINKKPKRTLQGNHKEKKRILSLCLSLSFFSRCFSMMQAMPPRVPGISGTFGGAKPGISNIRAPTCALRPRPQRQKWQTAKVHSPCSCHVYQHVLLHSLPSSFGIQASQPLSYLGCSKFQSSASTG